MLLAGPFKIGSRLLPTLTIGGASVAIEYVGVTRDRNTYRWYIDLPSGEEFSAVDLRSGCQGGETLQGMFGTLLSFLDACAEGIRYQDATGRESENADLFPRPVAEWARANQDEIGMLRLEIEETEGLLSSDDE